MKRVGIYKRIAEILREIGFTAAHGWQGQSRAFFVGGARLNANTIRDLKMTTESRLGHEVSISALERAIALIATEETAAERKAREAANQRKREASVAAEKAARDAKKLHDGEARREAAKVIAERKSRPDRRAWFETFTWDQIARLDTFAQEFFGATPRDSRIFAGFVIGACRRFGHAPGTPLAINVAFYGASEAEAEAAMRALFEPFFSTFFDFETESQFFARRTCGEFMIFARKEHREDGFAFELAARRTHDVQGDDETLARTFTIAIALGPQEVAPPSFHRIAVKRFDLEAIRAVRSQLIGEAKVRAAKPVRLNANERVRRKRLQWEATYGQ